MVEQDLHISERLAKLLPPLTPDERQQLKENIESDGRVREALVYWNDGKRNVVIDGMHRWGVVRGTPIPFRTEPIIFTSYEEAEIWILNHQLGRRNLLDPTHVRHLRGELYNRLKGAQDGNAADQLAEQTGVSERTVRRDGARVETLDTLVPAARKIAEQAGDKELAGLAALPPEQQNVVAREVRVGQSTLADAIKAAPAPPKDVPPLLRKYERAHWLKQWNTQIGHLVRLVDKIATEVGESKCKSHKTVQDLLEVASEEMQEWLGAKK